MKQEFAKALQIEETYQQSTGSANVTRPTSSELHLKSNKVLVSLFVQSERVNFEQFKQWIENHERATVLSRWLLVESCVNLSTELETPTFYQSLAGVTHLEEQVFDFNLFKAVFSLKFTHLFFFFAMALGYWRFRKDILVFEGISKNWTVGFRIVGTAD